MMLILKYICAVICIFCLLVFISNIITNLTSPQAFIVEEGKPDPAMKHAALRLILSIIIALTFSVLIVF